MLNVRILEIYSTYSIYLPLAGFLSIIFFFWVLLIYYNNFSVIELDIIKPHVNWIYYKNIKITAIGELLFNEGYILFIGATLLLFIAMIGAIILTLGKIEKKGYFLSHQNIVNWKYNSKD
jgi:NADH:ubiquinone oxidoreductase subunit 6 (subunit J)